MTWEKFVANMFSYSWDLLGVVMALTIIVGLLKVHRSDKYKNIDLMDLLIDSDSNKLSDSKFRLNMAFVLTSFVLIYLTLNGKLTEWYVTAFLGAWVVDRWSSRNASVQHQRVNRECGPSEYGSRFDFRGNNYGNQPNQNPVQGYPNSRYNPGRGQPGIDEG